MLQKKIPLWRILFFIQFFLMSGMILGCGAKAPQYRIWYELDPSTPSPQVKGNIQVTARYIGNDSSQAFRDIISRRVTKAPGQGELVQAFAGTQTQYLTGFDVEIQNNTDHILRLNDSRIYLVVGEDAIRCLTKSELLAWHSSPDIMQSRPNRIPVNMIDLQTEILPGFTQRGAVIFAVDPAIASIGSLRFFDLVSKVDKAGNPTERTNFAFKLIEHREEILLSTSELTSESVSEGWFGRYGMPAIGIGMGLIILIAIAGNN